MPVALLTGVTGQDGAYLSEFLIEKGYVVHGIKRRASMFNTGRIDHLIRDPHEKGVNLYLHYGDLTDSTSLIRIIQDVRPDEIYNLGAQSHVAVSFETPEYTANADAIGTLRLLEAIRILRMQDKVRFYQASTSELYGNGSPGTLDESSPFKPRSPYAAAKLYAFWITANYREAYGVYGSNGILFNHESPLRGETFVTRKITRAAARIKLGLQEKLYLGNLNAARDWGYAPDYVRAMWMILQRDAPDDYVVATGESHTVREFVQAAFLCVGIPLEWRGSGVEETGIDTRTGRPVIVVDPAYFRPAEVERLLGNASKARELLGWEPSVRFGELVSIMVRADLSAAGKAQYLKDGGFAVHGEDE